MADHTTGWTVGLLAANRQWKEQPAFRAVQEGLRRIGCGVRVANPAGADGPVFDEPVDACFVWNGRKGRMRRIAEALRAAGTGVIVLEHGFFDRVRHVQMDARGFGHRTSWADRLSLPAPRGAAARFRAVWGAPPTAVRPRRTGRILVLLQVPGDSQLDDSETTDPMELLAAVAEAAPDGVEVRHRPHPATSTPSAVSLRDDVAAARFVVTINSNAGNEALAWGCPVLCLGPALYAMAGTARQTTLAGMPDALAEMLAGWAPPPAKVRNYLHHLACRQFSTEELTEGAPLRRVLEQCHEL